MGLNSITESQFQYLYDVVNRTVKMFMLYSIPEKTYDINSESDKGYVPYLCTGRSYESVIKDLFYGPELYKLSRVDFTRIDDHPSSVRDYAYAIIGNVDSEFFNNVRDAGNEVIWDTQGDNNSLFIYLLCW